MVVSQQISEAISTFMNSILTDYQTIAGSLIFLKCCVLSDLQSLLLLLLLLFWECFENIKIQNAHNLM